MVLPGDPPEVYYGTDECGTCHAELDHGQHVCMADFTVPSEGHVFLSVHRDDRVIEVIKLQKGDQIEFCPVEDEQ